MGVPADRVALMAAGLLALAGVALRVIPAAPPSVEVAPPAAYQARPAPTGTERAATRLSYDRIVAADLFAPERVPPAERYTPPELAGDTSPEPVPAADPDVEPAPRLRLVGTAVGPEGSLALIDADPTIPGAEVFRVGDRVRGLRVVEILETAVILRGPQGRITLSLPRSLRR